MKLIIIYFNDIKNSIFEWYPKIYIWIILKIILLWNSYTNMYDIKNNSLNEIHIWSYTSSLYTAVKLKNIEIIKLLLENGNINVNFINIFFIYFL